MPAVELHFVDSGAGPPLVLLHAFPLSSAMWPEQRAALAADFRVLTPDLRGFGRSPLGVDDPSMDVMADDVAALLDRLGLAGVVLGGLSMGGYVAMAFLRRHRERVHALVLADTKASADPQQAADNRRRIADRLDREGSPQVLLDEVAPKLCGSTTKRERPEVYEHVRAMVEAVPPAAAAWAQRAMAARPDSFETLHATDVPALVIVGDEDELATPSDATLMVDALPQGKLVTVARAGHLTAVEAPGEVNTALRSLLATLG